MNVRLKRNSKLTLFTLLILIFTPLFTMVLFNLVNLGGDMDTTFAGDSLGPTVDEQDNYFPETSGITYENEKYDLSLWWNKTYRFRIGFVLEETEGIDRHQPVEIFFTFREDEHYENTIE